MRGSLRERGVDGAWLSRMGRDKTRRQRQHSRGPRQHEPRATRPRRQRPCGLWVAAWRLVAATPAAARQEARAPSRGRAEHAAARARRERRRVPPTRPRVPPPPKAQTLRVPPPSWPAGQPSPPPPNGTARAVTWPRRAGPTALLFFCFFFSSSSRRPSSPRRRAANDDQDSRSVRLPNPSSAPSRRETQARQSRRRACTVPAVQPANLCVFESRYLSFAC